MKQSDGTQTRNKNKTKTEIKLHKSGREAPLLDRAVGPRRNTERNRKEQKRKRKRKGREKEEEDVDHFDNNKQQ